MRTKKLDSKKLKITVVNALITFFGLIGASLAWFSSNRNADVGGLMTELQISPNLVISAKNGPYGEGTKSIYEVTSDFNDSISYTWSSQSKYLQPATHDWTVGTSTGLKFNNNPEKVYDGSGLSASKTDGSDLTYEAVPVYESGTTYYYIDFVAYLASVDREYKCSSLTASIEELPVNNTKTSELNTAYKSTSIDFYMKKVVSNNTITATSSNYKGTLNLNDTTHTINLLSGTDLTAVPLNTNASLAVLMRAYFDGALTYYDASTSSNKAYVNTKALATNTATVKFKISFDVV